MNNICFLVAFILYSIWNIATIADRTKRYPIEKYPFKFAIDVGYYMFMIYFLVHASINFLVLGTISFLVNAFFGIFVEFFRPDIDSRAMIPNEVMNNYWNYVGIDALITFTSFGLVMIGEM